MSGTSLGLDYYDNTQPIIDAIKRVMAADKRALPLMKQIGEYLVRSTHNRFAAQRSPEGIPWQKDTPAVWAKKQIKKILTESSHLKDSIIPLATNTSVEWGTNKIYGRIHQEGGPMHHPEREQVLHFKKGKDGNTRFHRANTKASFAMKATIGAHDTEMPARPYLGISSDDQREILLRVEDYYHRAALP
jgi:phage virion morphogenesis protein